jgi:hypothetical protein
LGLIFNEAGIKQKLAAAKLGVILVGLSFVIIPLA